MHRIDTSTAQKDKFGQGKNGFTDGDPSTGRQSTDLNADMFDALQEEVCAVIEAANITLKKGELNQLLTALKVLFLAEDDSRVSGALQKDKNLSDLTDSAKAREALALDKVGNWVAVQQGGGTGMKDNKVYLGWSGTKLIAQVDSTQMGELFYNNNPPPYPVTSVNSKTGAVSLGKSDVGLGNVGNWVAVQQGGGANQGSNKIYLGWGADGKLRLTVDSSDEGAMYYENNPPPYPVTSVNGATGAVTTATANLAGGWEKNSATGRIRQWGSINAGTRGHYQVNFPITFPNACANVQVTAVDNGVTVYSDNYATAGNVTQAGFLCGQDNNGAYWEAIGW
ncbi:hypothetical protein F3I27_22030 [Pantoea sp. Bo_2]|nr:MULTISPECIES: hypothetical protein [unclassified Pantoea]KAA6040857.1 hypothetical protein F3I36_21910 [Pantoea sp. FN_2b]KAA6045038.1 hypothetical protein F3I34_22040 [Pantoea sp. Bo_5]KAA6054136.1 hypothetical protein F3I33_21855 [Pantoea sp. Bo_46]KAA6054219.1 hypothetical protein F3I32_22090 [Pantoea sp. Bo_40]KAA6058194.1 hypothetical protein F3I29_21820 [Pantoea sp. Bo_3]